MAPDTSMKTFLPLIIVTLAEATIGVFVKLTDGQVPIFALNFYRVFFAALFLGVVMTALNKKFLKFPKNNARDIFIIGALIALQISSYNLAMSLTSIANAVIFWSIAPFFVFIFSWKFLHESPKKQYILIFMLALAGLFIAEPFSSSNANAVGNSIALFTGVVYAGAVTYMRHEGTTETTNDVFWFMGAATLYLLPTLLIDGPGDILAESNYTLFGLPVPTLLWAICLGVISTGVAYLFISFVLKRIDANVYSLVDIIVSPLIAGLLGYLIFNEVPNDDVVIGGILLLGSGFWLTRSMAVRKKQHYREKTPASVK